PPRSTLFPYTTLFRSFRDLLVTQFQLDPQVKKELLFLSKPGRSLLVALEQLHADDLLERRQALVDHIVGNQFRAGAPLGPSNLVQDATPNRLPDVRLKAFRPAALYAIECLNRR